MTAVYAPLQNASPSQRGAITNAAQEIAGAKHFLDPLTAEELVAQWLELPNDYTENFTIEAAPFTATGVPLSIGGPTTDAAPFWGLRAQAVPIGGEVGTITSLGLGLFPGGGPVDLIGIDVVPNLAPGLVLGTSGGGSSAALVGTRVSLGLTADTLNHALEFDEGLGSLRASLSLDYADAVLRSGALPFRYSSGAAIVAELRHAGNTAPPTFGTGVEWQLMSAGPAAFTRGLGGGFADGVVCGPITDSALGALTAGVHLVAPQGLDQVATFGWWEAGEYTSAARVHPSGAYEMTRPNQGPADTGVFLATGTHGNQVEFNVDAASGAITPPTTDPVEAITINSPAILATSIPRVEVVGNPVTTTNAWRPLVVIQSVAAGSFTFTFKETIDPASVCGWAVGGTGSIRWEVAR